MPPYLAVPLNLRRPFQQVVSPQDGVFAVFPVHFYDFSLQIFLSFFPFMIGEQVELHRDIGFLRHADGRDIEPPRCELLVHDLIKEL